MMDIRTAADSVVQRLMPVAEKRGVKLTVSGDSVEREVIPQVLEEIIYNLVDNAIKYNRPEGSVHVDVGSDQEKGYVSVKDTGIGISEEDQHRVFERFYRVDKAHTREVGGTGLGLSIVKHGVRLLGADIEIDSRLGEGTEIRVIFQ